MVFPSFKDCAHNLPDPMMHTGYIIFLCRLLSSFIQLQYHFQYHDILKKVILQICALFSILFSNFYDYLKKLEGEGAALCLQWLANVFTDKLIVVMLFCVAAGRLLPEKRNTF